MNYPDMNRQITKVKEFVKKKKKKHIGLKKKNMASSRPNLTAVMISVKDNSRPINVIFRVCETSKIS